MILAITTEKKGEVEKVCGGTRGEGGEREKGKTGFIVLSHTHIIRHKSSSPNDMIPHAWRCQYISTK